MSLLECSLLLVATLPALVAHRIHHAQRLDDWARDVDIQDPLIGKEEFSPYIFSWANMSFEERWELFRNAVPLSELQDNWDPSTDTGPVCHPSLEGPRESKKLAVLIHGFTACPGTYYPLTKKLLAAGFRVLRPTLPGHGRKWHVADTEVYAMHDDGELGINTTSVGIQDDLSQFPSEPRPYLYFADALGQLVEQFKMEHPDGLVVVAGHSLGGMVAAKFAIERPKVVDRLLLMNPMLNLPTLLMRPFLNLGSDLRVSWETLGEKNCETMRGENSGGVCQFKLSNVLAMQALACTVLCYQWGLQEACRLYSLKGLGYAASIVTAPLGGGVGGLLLGSVTGPIGAAVGFGIGAIYGAWLGPKIGSEVGKLVGTLAYTDRKVSAEIRKGFADLKQVQAITTDRDPAVDNKALERLMDEIDRQKQKRPDWEDKKQDLSYCSWPKIVGHGYNNDRDLDSDASRWIHPYVETALSKFLATGTFVDIVRSAPLPFQSKHIVRFGHCLEREDQVSGELLTVLPALQNRQDQFLLGGENSTSITAKRIYMGNAKKQSELVGLYRWRMVELFAVPMGTILVTRKASEGYSVRDVFLLAGRGKITNGECIRTGLRKLSNAVDLVGQLHANSTSPILQLQFCTSQHLISKVCSLQGCD